MSRSAKRLAGGLSLGVTLYCLAGGVTTTAATSGEPLPVHTRAQFEQAMASAAPTPLDALTPEGKRAFIRRLRWGEHGLGGFNYTPLVRELDRAQLDAALRFLDLAAYQAMLDKDLVGAPLRLPAPSADVAARLARLEEIADADDRARRDDDAAATRLATPAVLRAYQDLFGERMQALRAQPLGDLLPLFDAAVLAAGSRPDSVAAADLARVHGELAARGVDTRRHLDRAMLSAMLAERRFEPARAFVAVHPDLAGTAIPTVADPLGAGVQGRSVYDYDAARNTLTRRALPVPPGNELVMVIDAGCHYSRAALDALAADAAFAARLRAAHLLIITPPHSAIAFDFVKDWNAAHPTLPIRIAANAQDWQAIDVAGLPEFYLLRDGHRIGKRSGWPDEGNKAAVIALAEGTGNN